MPDSPPPAASGLRPATVAVVAGRPTRAPDAPLNEPVTFASTYHAGGPVGYGRSGNPTWTAFETAVSELEGGSALAFASGLGAAAAVLDLLSEGAVVVVPEAAYHGTRALLAERAERGRATVRSVDVTATEAVAAAAEGADLVWLESPTNPCLDVADIPAAAAAARRTGALLVVDNTFATPVRQQPLLLGADVVVHSATKFLAGHSDVVLGLAAVRDPGLLARLADHRTLHGAVPGPMETWLALRGLRTLALRVDRAEATARELARRLAGHPVVARVRYPGWGALLAVEPRGGAAAADVLASAVRLWVHATSLGGVESSLERRRRWPTESPTVPAGLVRMSVGIEDVEDLWDDLDAALHTCQALRITSDA